MRRFWSKRCALYVGDYGALFTCRWDGGAAAAAAAGRGGAAAQPGAQWTRRRDGETVCCRVPTAAALQSGPGSSSHWLSSQSVESPESTFGGLDSHSCSPFRKVFPLLATLGVSAKFLQQSSIPRTGEGKVGLSVAGIRSRVGAQREKKCGHLPHAQRPNTSRLGRIPCREVTTVKYSCSFLRGRERENKKCKILVL